MRYFLTVAVLLTSLTVHSAEPTTPAVPGRTRVFVISEPLRGNTPDLTINGKRVAAIGVDAPYSGVFDSGKLTITVPGGSIDIHAEANKDYVFEVSLIPSATGGLLFGIVGASAMATYRIVLKETRTLELPQQQQQATEKPRPSREQTKDSPQVAVSTEEIRAAQRVVAMEPQNSVAWADLGRLYSTAGANTESIRAYEEAARLTPDDPRVLEGLGAAYAKAGQSDKVRAVWQKLGAVDKARADKFFAAHILP